MSIPAKKSSTSLDWRPPRDIVQIMKEREVAGHFLTHGSLARTARKFKLDVEQVGVYLARTLEDVDLHGLRRRWSAEHQLLGAEARRAALTALMARIDDMDDRRLTHLYDTLDDNYQREVGEPTAIIEERHSQAKEVRIWVDEQGVLRQQVIDVPIDQLVRK